MRAVHVIEARAESPPEPLVDAARIIREFLGDLVGVLVHQHQAGRRLTDIEKREHDLFGAEGFERMVDCVDAIEKQLGIYRVMAS